MVQKSIKQLDEVIQRDPEFSEGAHYYKAYALGKKIDWKNQEEIASFKHELQTAKVLFEKRSEEALQCSGIVNEMKESFESTGIIQINSYEEQKQSLVSMYGLFISSIDDALGANITADSFTSGVIDDHMSVELFNNLLKNNLLEKMRFSTVSDKERVEELCKNYGIPSPDMEVLLKRQKGEEVEHTSLVSILESAIKLSSCDKYWEELVEKQIIINSQYYVIANEDKLCEAFPMVFPNKTMFDTLREEKFQERLSSSSTLISKTVEQVLEAPESSSFFKKTSFLKMLTGISFERLIEKQCVTEVEVADWNGEVETVQFNTFDKQTPYNFDGECIPVDDVMHVLNDLVKQKLLSKLSENYYLEGNYQQVHNLQLQEPLNIYTPAVKAVLQRNFAYRIAYQRIQSQRMLLLALLAL